jgi:N-acetylneuraminic acid mutarotase
MKRRWMHLIAGLTMFVLCISICTTTTNATATGEWTWMSGSDIVDQAGIYGTKGSPTAANIPGGRRFGLTWVDTGGDLWLFGGWGFDSAETYSDLNDLWHYNTTSGEWTWVTGSDTGNQTGTYGTKGTPAANNTPGGRAIGNSFVDANGDFWLFGGKNYSCKGAIGWVSEGYRNDLWRYDISTSEWTWMSGSDIADQTGNYGTKGTPDAANIPGARWESFSGDGVLTVQGGLIVSMTCGVTALP